MPYIHRTLESTLSRYIKSFSVVGLTGPRQSGKSTLLKKILGNQYKYVSFDDFDILNRFNDDPQRFISQYSDKIIFDEVQKAPEIFNYVKLAVDEDRGNKGKFILTGSSQFIFMKHVSESLAGRIGLLSLLPMQYAEVPKHLKEDSIFKGGYPELIIGNYESSADWYSSYLDTYLTRDIRSLLDIGNIRDLKRCIQILASHTSQILNISEISRDIGVSVPTIKKWISVLEASYILFLVPPYYNNMGKRIVKSPKVYFFDTGLVSYLTGIRNTEIFEQGPMYGSIFENYIVSEIVKNNIHSRSDAEIFYYRTSNGVEIDLIIDHKSHQDFFEIKSSETFRPEMIQSVKHIKQNNSQGFLLYRGKDLDTVTDIKILNYRTYLEQFEK